MSLFRRGRRPSVPLPPAVLPPSSAFLAPTPTVAATPPLLPSVPQGPPHPPPAHHEEPADLTTRGPLPGAGGVAVLLLDQGSELRLDRSWVIGRDPVPPVAHPDAVPFGIADATRSVSKTHLVIGPDPGGAWVVDLHSTNGVLAHLVGAAPRRLDPGQVITVPFGTTITYGERSIVIRA